MFRQKEPPSTNIILSSGEVEKLASFFNVLIVVDRRISKEKENTKASRRNAQSSRKKDADLGSQMKRALYYFVPAIYRLCNG